MAGQDEGKAFNLTSTAHGLALMLNPQGLGRPTDLVVQHAEPTDKTQQWTLDQGDEAGVVAIKNVANGQYLHAFTAGNGARVGTGEKQWWKIGRNTDNPPKHLNPPGACWLSPVDYPRFFLNHFEGLTSSPTKVWMWEWWQAKQYCLAWYFVEPGASFNSQGIASAEHADAKKSATTLKDLEQREAALARKEAEVSAREDAIAVKTKDVEQREAALAKKEQSQTAQDNAKDRGLREREDALAQKEKALAAQQAAQEKQKEQLNALEKELASKGKPSPAAAGDTPSQQKELQRKLDQVQAAERDLAAKQAAIEKQKKQLDGLAADLKRKADECKAADKDLAGRQAALDKQAQQNKTNEEKLRQREADLAKKPKGSDHSEGDRLKAENERLKLQLRLKDLENELAEAKRAKSAAAPTTVANGTSPTSQDRPDRLAKLETENARLKSLIAQQVRRQQQTPAVKSETSAAPSKPAEKQTPSSENEVVNGVKGAPTSSSMPKGATPAKPAIANTSKSVTKPVNSGVSNGAMAKTHPEPAHPSTSRQPTPNQVPAHKPSPASNGRSAAPPAPIRQNGHTPAAKPAPSTASSTSAKPHAAHKPFHTSEHTHGPEEDAVRYKCGHVAHPLPRKLDRKIVAILYDE